MLLVPPRKSGQEEEEKSGRRKHNTNRGEDVPPPPESSAAKTTAARRGPDIPPQSGRDMGRRPNKCRARVGDGKNHGDDIPELLPCSSGSEITSGDVWGMLDSYVHRRSEVTRANRHLGVIEAMRRVRQGEARRVQLVGSSRFVDFCGDSPPSLSPFMHVPCFCVVIPRQGISCQIVPRNGIAPRTRPADATARVCLLSAV